MITNSGFTSGAKAAAKDEGIALIVVQPNLNYSLLPKTDRAAIQKVIQEVVRNSESPVYTHETHLKAVNLNISAYLTKIESALRDAPDKETFQLKVLCRELKYLEWLIDLTQQGLYGSEADIPDYKNGISKTQMMIDKIIDDINKQKS